MDQAEELFVKLQSFKNSKEFLEYCNQVLGTVERIHVDFKEKHDRRIPKLEDNDKKNLAKAMSGFANSGGGVLIWGIEDKTLKAKPIAEIQQFMQNLLQLAPQVTDPIARDIDGYWIVSNSKSGEGFGILFIPESLLPPHRVILKNKEVQNNYFMRSGNSFIVASHTMLEDMFGRRPKPDPVMTWRVEHAGRGGKYENFMVILSIENKGRGTAKSPFLSVTVHEPYTIYRYGIDGNG
ncbi:MAG TPA: ATP-binding protein, partial [Anaerolineales bacterium]|nr:ATP-binding protein [Anaerolineales bacterium]